MVRSAASFLAILILPGFLAAQQMTPKTHKVVHGDTLWELAYQFYGNPFQWRRIYEANKDKIRDPNLIYPDQEFVIPGKQAEVTGVQVQPAQEAGQAGAQKPVQRPVRTQAPAADMAHRHTILYKDTAATTAAASVSIEDKLPPIGRGRVYAAPWLVRGEGDPGHVGTVAGQAGPDSPTETVLAYDRIRLDMTGSSPGVGDEFITYHVERTIPAVGRVVMPTGLVRVTSVDEGSVVGVVTEEYAHLRNGDFVGPVPSYSLKPGQKARPVSNGPEAMVMGLADPAQIAGMGQVVFLDLGSNDGIAVGDEFEVRDWGEGGHLLEGTLQVVGVKSETSSARVVYIKDNVFHKGLVVRLSKKMD